MSKRKHDAMYSEYGKQQNNHICRECCNFAIYQMSNKRVSKCAAYGITHSEATDWNGRKTACGLFNVLLPDDDIPLIEKLKKSLTNNENIKGQISLI